MFAVLTLILRLEVFNAILSRNLADNPNVVYNIVRAHKTFEDLGTYTLARGLREIRRIQLAKEEQPAKSGDKGTSRTNSSEVEQPHDEKARLLRDENSNSVDLPRPDGPVDDIEAQRQSTSDGERATARPLTSPPIITASLADSQQTGPSEKVRGKMRAGRSGSEDLTGSLERLAAAGVGRNGFVPTQEWVCTS